MTFLIMLGFILLCFAASLMTAVLVSIFFGESVFSGKLQLTYVFAVIAAALWWAVFHFVPFTVTYPV